MELFKEKFEQYKHFSILSYYLIIITLYNTYEKLTVPKYIMHSKIDDYIPFIKQMVIPYLFWYIYIIMALVYLGFASKKDFYNLSAFMFIGMTICFAIYAVFPNGQNLRPAITGNDIFSKLVYYIYMADTPTNSAPSMHVLDSIAVHAALVNCESLKNKLWVKVSSFITMLLIIISTVTIKQHSILDVLYGIILSAILYLIIYNQDLLKLFTSDESYRKVEE